MQPLRALIIEDEPLAMERTTLYVGKVPYLELATSFDNALDGLAYLRENPVDLLYLDVHMDELTGIELLSSTHLDCAVILTTAFPQYALQGYALNVTDYLLKPFTFPRFLQATEKARNLVARHGPAPDYLFVKTENRLERIAVADILFIEGMSDYRRIHTTSQRIMTLQTFGELAGALPKDKVCRIHRSYMVGLANIDAVERSRVVIGKERIPISDTYRATFLELINKA